MTSYLEVDTVQGTLVVDTDRITGIGGANDLVVLFLSGDHVDVIMHSPEQALSLIDAVKKILIQRKIRQPSKPILISKE